MNQFQFVRLFTTPWVVLKWITTAKLALKVYLLWVNVLSSGLHGANRLGSNSLAELVVLGRVAGEYAAQRAAEARPANRAAVDAQAQDVVARLEALYNQEGNESWSES